jgi:hypothetical protein
MQGWSYGQSKVGLAFARCVMSLKRLPDTTPADYRGRVYCVRGNAESM